LLRGNVDQIQTTAQPFTFRVRQLSRALSQIIRQHQPQRTGANGVGKVMRAWKRPASRKQRRSRLTLCHEIK